MFRKKLENFWYYHKYKVIIAIFAIITIIVASSGDSGGEADLEIGYVIGNREVILQNLDENKALFESLIQGKDKEKAIVSILPITPSRLEVEFVIGISQIFLLDKETLLPIINHHFFEPLDSYVDKYNIDLSGFPEVKADPDGENNYKVYAIPVKKLDMFLEMGFPEDYYFAIRLPKENDKDDVMRNKNAHIVLEYILKNSQ
ncbi:hypothetical protein [Acetivibrio clariflavus]|uniref:hypothetical protein n=1 Tax=Acetivibrio clariflavus TaxID=288965 RepID=UPI000487DFB5|nr:hypothetical protein [Acetivibrio clariflavus]